MTCGLINVIRTDDDRSECRCGSCDAVIYPDAKIVRNHDLTRTVGGRVRVYSRDFETVVHLCEHDNPHYAPTCAIFYPNPRVL